MRTNTKTKEPEAKTLTIVKNVAITVQYSNCNYNCNCVLQILPSIHPFVHSILFFQHYENQVTMSSGSSRAIAIARQLQTACSRSARNSSGRFIARSSSSLSSNSRLLGANTHIPKNIIGSSLLNKQRAAAMSSMADPGASLFRGDLPTVVKDSDDLDKLLRSDVKTMGSILGTYSYCIEILS